MTTFDLAEVRNFAAELEAELDRCDNGEGMECATLDAAIRNYAAKCRKFCTALREWGQAVFTGRVAADPEVEKLWKAAGERLFGRARGVLEYASDAEEGFCYTLEGKEALQSALWDLYRLFTPWVTPTLAVGPSARPRPPLDEATIAEARQRIEELPPLPADWQPSNRQHVWLWYKQLRQGRKT